MALDLNASPYYDDFSSNKDYHRILFKPGVAVQARELTQIQSILQNQIDKGFGFTLQEGAIVTGCAEDWTDVEWVKIMDTDSGGTAVDNSTLLNFVGDTVTGGTSGIKAKIVDTATGTEAGSPKLKKLYLQYTDMAGQTTYEHFTASETLTVTSTDSGRNNKTFVVGSGTSATAASGNYYGKTKRLTLQEGLIFAKGAFIRTGKISVIQSRFTGAANTSVGFLVTEETVNSATDTTLLDPAQGSFNYNAPGADRLKYSVTLAAYESDETIPENFFVYYRAEFGTRIFSRVVDNPLADLGGILATRTFDESGSYVVNGMVTEVREHLKTSSNNGVFTVANGGDADGLVFQVAPGKAYVGGHKRTLLQSKKLIGRKTSDTVTKEDLPISTSYGNYIQINYVSGIFDIDGGASIDLYNAVQNGNASAQGTKVGTAKARHIVYQSGTAGATAAVYRLYIYDIKMLSGDFTAVRGIRSENTIADGIADAVLNASSVPEIKEAERNKLLFSLPYQNIDTLAAASGGVNDYTFHYTKEFDATLDASSGAVTLNLSSAQETFPYTTDGNDLSDTIKNANIIVVAKNGFVQNSATVAAGQFIDLTDSNVSVTLSDNKNITIDTGGAITTTGAQDRTIKVYVNVQYNDGAAIAKTLNSGIYVKIDTSSHPFGTTGEYPLGLSDAYQIESIRAHSSAFSTGTEGTDVTADFRFVTGQTDNFYGHSKIFKKSTSTLNLSTNNHLLVKLKYFSHNNTAGGFFCVDSYPVDDSTSPGANTIRTENIPIYRSSKQGDFDLRDTLDFRPAMTNTATASTTIAGASTNPDITETINRPGNGLQNPVPVKTFTTDLRYYRGKKIITLLDKDGEIKFLEGAYAEKPLFPETPEGGMLLARITLPAYPCLAPDAAKAAGRPDYAIRTEQAFNRRYTMKDIGVLEERIKNLEYYASLNLLETYAKDQTIVDSTGVDRFKNGILVDQFTGHKTGAVLDPDYKISVDPKRKHARPFFALENIPLKEGSDIGNPTTALADNKLMMGKKLVSLPYESINWINQPQASQTENLVKELQFTYSGDLTLTPDTDNFVATDVQPAVTRNFDGNYDAWENMADAWGTQWGSWEDTAVQVQTNVQELNTFGTNNSGTSISQSSLFTTTTTTTSQSRTGTSLNVSATTESQSIGSSVIDVSFQPFMRATAVVFFARRMKPNTRVYPYFDGEDVTADCQQNGGTLGGAITTDANGEIVGTFNLPAGRFKSGVRVFKLQDQLEGSSSRIRSLCQANYESTGLRQQTQENIIALKTANVSATQHSDDRVVTDTSMNVSIGQGTPLPPPPAPVIITQVTNVVGAPGPVGEPGPVGPPGEDGTPGTPADPVDVPAIVDTVLEEIEPRLPPPPPDPPVVDIPDFDLDEIMGFIGGIGMDPLAQTFKVSGLPGGVFISGVEIYFKTKSDTRGVTMELREVINGVPGPRILPNGSVYKNASNINVSSESGGVTTFTPTHFRFEDLVYLKNDTEYCIVPKPELDDPSFEIWIAQLGENQFGTTNRIDKQPHAGMFFSSANNRTWTPYQNKDMMFKIYRARFKKGTNITGTFVNQKLDYLNFTDFSTNQKSFDPGANLVGFTPTLTNGGSGYTGTTPTVSVTNATGDTGTGLTLSATVTGDAVTGLTVTNPGSGYKTAPTITISDEGGSQATGTVALTRGIVTHWNTLYNYASTVLRTGTFTSGMLVGAPSGYATLSSFTDKVVDEVALNIGIMKPGDGTTASAKIALTTTGAAVANSTTYEEIDFNLSKPLDVQKTIYAYSTEQKSTASGGYNGENTARLQTTFYTFNDNTSPILDIDQCDLLCIKNELNNDATGEAGRGAGNASSRYISRRVILEEGMDAEDLRVYLDAEIPNAGDIKVYAKLQNAADPGDFQEDLSWFELTKTGFPAEVTEEMAEYYWTIPSKPSGANVYGLNGSGKFEYSLDVVSSTTNLVGGSGFTSVPTVSVTGGGGFGAQIRAEVSGGAVTSLIIENPGRGYTSTPTIAITGGGGSGASADAVTGTITYTGYKTFAVKIVPLCSNTVEVPKFKDLRAIALQA